MTPPAARTAPREPNSARGRFESAAERAHGGARPYGQLREGRIGRALDAVLALLAVQHEHERQPAAGEIDAVDARHLVVAVPADLGGVGALLLDAHRLHARRLEPRRKALLERLAQLLLLGVLLVGRRRAVEDDRGRALEVAAEGVRQRFVELLGEVARVHQRAADAPAELPHELRVGAGGGYAALGR